MGMRMKEMGTGQKKSLCHCGCCSGKKESEEGWLFFSIVTEQNVLVGETSVVGGQSKG